MGKLGTPGLSFPSGQNPVTQAGMMAMTGSPTVQGGMLGISPYQSIDPNAPASMVGQMGQMGQMGGQDQNQLMQPFAQYPGRDGGGGGAESR
jgi:hypothetical protein